MSFGNSGGRALLTCVAGFFEDEGFDGALLGAFSVGFLLTSALLLDGGEVAFTNCRFERGGKSGDLNINIT
jgi:sensor domain CHASE-containing protein